jgi:NADH-quinone oxidoreductase subunit L
MLTWLSTVIILAPLLGAITVGLLGRVLGRRPSHCIAILAVAISCAASLWLLGIYFQAPFEVFEKTLYIWGQSAGIPIEVGVYIDSLTLAMMCTVTFVSLMVHIYTIGYMHDDSGYQRFFAYINFFTFSMLMLVMSNNFMQLFFGWEAVGVTSYLLIGFWFKRPTAIYANLKAFIVNRVGDFGFLLGIAAVFLVFGSLNYGQVFADASLLSDKTLTLWSGTTVSMATATCILLFIGAMGKSAQVPLHVWLPDSMEGPTPISALIHAATMVTAGVFMVARMSPLFEQSTFALSFILVIGGTTALFMGFVGIVQNDIKRVIAYSTLSQLGYMMIAVGASAYAAGIFHLMTHAFFKALLFLGAGSVIIAMHHEQDMRKMGGLWRYMPITYVTMLIGSLALSGIPPFAGFYSKDSIIEAVKLSTIPGAGYAYFAAVAGVAVTAIYSFRLMFMVFHNKPRMDDKTKSHLKESPWVVTVPLVLLAIPSVAIGYILVGPMLFNENAFLNPSLFVLPQNDVLAKLGEHYHGALAFALHAPQTLVFWLAVGGIALMWALYMQWREIPAKIQQHFKLIYTILVEKYGFDAFNDWFFAKGSREVGNVAWQVGDVKVIDGAMVNGSAQLVGRIAKLARHVQSGFLNQYVQIMILGLLGLISWWLWTWVG